MVMPRIFPTPEDLEQQIESYFAACENQEVTINFAAGPARRQKPLTISGLCVYMGISRELWSTYKARPDYKEIIGKALLRTENRLEEGMLTGEIPPIPAIFALKNNYGWRDSFDLNVDKQQPEKLTEEEIKRHLAERQQARLTSGDES